MSDRTTQRGSNEREPNVKRSKVQWEDPDSSVRRTRVPSTKTNDADFLNVSALLID